MTARRGLVAAILALACGRAVAQQAQMVTIGTARMEADGTIVLDLVARDGATTGQGRLTYPRGHRDYDMILRHLGGLRPGETKAVMPFP